VSKLLKAQQDAKAALGDRMKILGNSVLVERIPPKEIKSQSGLILSAGAEVQRDGIEMNKPILVRVVDTGPGLINDRGELEANVCQPGNIALVGQNSVLWHSTWAGTACSQEQAVGRMLDSQAHHIWADDAAYEEYCAAFQAGLK